MQSISVFMDTGKFADIRRKIADVSRTNGVCHVIQVELRQVSSFYHFSEGGLFALPIREQPQKSPS